MSKGTAPKSEEPTRAVGLTGLTMDEAWELARPRVWSWMPGYRMSVRSPSGDGPCSKRIGFEPHARGRSMIHYSCAFAAGGPCERLPLRIARQRW
jgi:hypothetical protein